MRVVSSPPLIEGFKPVGNSSTEQTEKVVLLFEEYEAIRLSDYEGLIHEQAASMMNVSRPTYTRIYEKARRKIARAFVEGREIAIGGGNFTSADHWYRCGGCRRMNVSKEDERLKCEFCDSRDIEKLTVVISSDIDECDHDTKKCSCRACGAEVTVSKGTPCRDTPCPECCGKMSRR